MDNQLPRAKASPKDVFLQLLSMVAFYTTVISFLVLVFQYINLGFPDPLEAGYYARDAAMSSIRWSIATLVVVFPAYIVLSWFINKQYALDPEKRNIRIRKWLTYLTLSIAAIVVVGDLVTLVFNFLEGDLTARFLLKVLAVFFAAGSSFIYYFWDIRRHSKD